MNPTLPVFQGPMAKEFGRFVQQMATTGGQHRSLFTTVRRLDRFLGERHPDATVLSRTIVAEWFASQEAVSPRSQRRYRSSTFLLCRFFQGHQPSTAVAADFETPRRAPPFQPYIFSAAEVGRLLESARALSTRPTDPLRPWTVELALSLLYSAGLRIGEVIRFNVRDFDVGQGTLRVLETKFAKSRLVALSPSASALVVRYLDRRRTLGLTCCPGDPLVWPLMWSSARPRSCLGSFQVALVRLLRECGMKPPKGRLGPRIHDLRHTFAVHRVLQWYREGVDVQARLPHLVTYMGHRDLESTQHYLSLTPEVLREANLRFEKFANVVGTGDGR